MNSNIIKSAVSVMSLRVNQMTSPAVCSVK